VRERFDVVEAKRSGAEQPLPSVETEEPSHTNGVHKSREQSNASPTPEASTTKREPSSDISEVIDDVRPPKKRKVSTEDDAAMAARLQAEEDGRARPTRGGAPRKAAPAKKKKTPKKKTSARVTGSDDSDVPSEDKPKKNTGFHVS
jgi:upstream activation factor subunit UAF30